MGEGQGQSRRRSQSKQGRVIEREGDRKKGGDRQGKEERETA